jgi:hypothetical protein
MKAVTRSHIRFSIASDKESSIVDEAETPNNRASRVCLDGSRQTHYKFEGSKIELESHDPVGHNYPGVYGTGREPRRR